MEKDWKIQLIWFLAGVLATGAVWHFLATDRIWFTGLTAAASVFLVALAIWFHRISINPLHESIILYAGEERISFEELVRTQDFDLLRVVCHNHEAGIAAEYEWIRRRYPKAKVLEQQNWVLPGPSGVEDDDDENSRAIFDTIILEFPDGRIKEIYFEISSFFKSSDFGREESGRRFNTIFESFYGPIEPPNNSIQPTDPPSSAARGG